MAKAIALRSFDHNGKVAKGDDLSNKFDIITLRALKRSGLISLEEDGSAAAPVKTAAPKAPVPTVGSLGNAPKPKVKDKTPKAPKAGGKSSASQAVQASTNATLPPSTPGALPPPLPVV